MKLSDITHGIILISMREVLSSVLFLPCGVTPCDLVSCFCATSCGLERSRVFPLCLHVSCAQLVVVTSELLFVLNPLDLRNWAQIPKLTWSIYDEYEREEKALCESRYWEMVEEGWFSD